MWAILSENYSKFFIMDLDKDASLHLLAVLSEKETRKNFQRAKFSLHTQNVLIRWKVPWSIILILFSFLPLCVNFQPFTAHTMCSMLKNVFSLCTCSICVTVIVLNIHFRSPQTHTMAPWVRTIFINHLPKLLVIKRPVYGGLDQYR